MTVKSINGLAIASIKSINGLAIASVKSYNGLALPVAVTYATWNPSDKSSNITLSNGNLTVGSTSSVTWDSIRSTIGKSS